MPRHCRAGAVQPPPSAWNRLHIGLEPGEPGLRQGIVRLKEALLGVQHGQEIDGAGTKLGLGDSIGASGDGHRIRLQLLLERRLPHRDQGVLDILERGEDGLPVVLQQLHIAAALALELALEAVALEDRLGQPDGQIVELGGRIEERVQRVAREATLHGELDAGEHGRARHPDIGVGRLELGLGLAHVGPADQKLGRQPRRHGRYADGRGIATRDGKLFGRAPEQDRERILRLLELLLEGRDGHPLGRHHALLLGEVEGGGRANRDPRLDRPQHAKRYGEVLPGDLQARLQSKNWK